MFEQRIQIVIIALVVIAVILAVLLCYLCIRKWSANQHASIVENFREQLRSPLQRYLLHGGEITDQLMPGGDRLKFEALESLLSQFSDFLSSSDIELRIRVYAEHAFAGQYQKWLNARGSIRKLNVLLHIDKFGLRSFEYHLLEWIKSGKGINLAHIDLIYRILAAFGSEELLILLSREPPALPDSSYRYMFARIPEQLFPLFVDLFPHLTLQLRLALIDVIGIRQRDLHIGFLEALLDERDSELRIRALKALSEMPHLTAKERYMSHAEADDWQERMMAAKLFGTIRNHTLLPYLESMLGDSSWWVRQQAGQSIMRYREGRDILTRIRYKSQDRFARDIASEWLDKGESAIVE
jgi:hypothetical protein